MNQTKLRAGVVGATGMVGQRFLTLLANHPYFTVTALAASASSAGKPYEKAVEGRWKLAEPMPDCVKGMVVRDASDVEGIKPLVDFVFCAVDMPKAQVRELEESYAKAEIPVVSNNSACRGLSDVPMLIPEINSAHTAVIATQRKRLGTTRGFIAVKPNCSIQSYVPALTPLLSYGVEAVNVTTLQAISGAGKTFDTFPDILDNVIPYIGGEEEKSEREPLKIWGSVRDGEIVPAEKPVVAATCTRVPVQDGHLAVVSVKFAEKPSREQILAAWDAYRGEAQKLRLPSAPERFLTYFDEPDRPQSRLDRGLERGMGIAVGRLREDPLLDWRFVCLSHNTLRGAAGGAVLSAELLYRQGYLQPSAEA